MVVLAAIAADRCAHSQEDWIVDLEPAVVESDALSIEGVPEPFPAADLGPEPLFYASPREYTSPRESDEDGVGRQVAVDSASEAMAAEILPGPDAVAGFEMAPLRDRPEAPPAMDSGDADPDYVAPPAQTDLAE